LVVAYLRGRWGQVWWRDGLDSAASVLLALGAGWCVPSAVRGDTTNWLYIALVGQLFVPAWLAPLASAAPLALISAAAYLAGTVVTPAALAGGSSAAVSAAVLVAIAAAAWCARLLLERGAFAADATLATADREAREQRVALSRTTERREHERLLHDTVLNTLTAIGRAGGADAGRADAGGADAGQLVGRCRRAWPRSPVPHGPRTPSPRRPARAPGQRVPWPGPRRPRAPPGRGRASRSRRPRCR
jgi:signal transduction histidine kinase